MSKTQDAFHNWLAQQGPLDSVQFWHCWKAASELSAQRIAELEVALAQRSKQIGVACMKHDLVHSLVCGICFYELEQQRDELLATLIDVDAALVGMDKDGPTRKPIRAAIAKVKS